MSVKISELPVLDNLADNDILAGVDTSANITAKVTLGSLKQYIDTNTQYTAGTNIDITNNVVSAPNVYTKTEIDNAIATEASLKENKANKVTGLSSSSTDTQYPSAKCVYDHVDGVKETILANVGEDIGEVNQSIEELQEENDELQSEVDSLSTIFNAFPTESGEGESVTLDDTAEVKFKKFDLKGNTSQETTTGKNLLNVVDGTYSQNGITAVVSNGEITLNGTSTNNAFISFIIDLKQNDVVSYSVNNSSTSSDVSVRFFRNATSGTYGSVNLSVANRVNENITLNQDYDRFQIRVATGITLSNFKLKPMIVKGTTAGDYEPYTGGIASPNPNYPQDIHVVSGDNEINVCGKNLFNANEVQIGKAWNGTNNSARAVIIIPVEKNVAYTISMNGNNSMEGVYVSYSAKALEENYINGVGLSQITTFPRTYTSSTNYIILQFNKSSVSLSDIENLKLQVEKGSSASTYEPYVSSSYQVNLPIENILDITSSGSSIGGVPFTIENGIIKINGTTSSSTASYYFNTFRTKSESAMFSIEVTGYTDKSSGNSALILQQSDDGTTGWSTLSELSLNSVYAKQNSVTLDSSKYYRLRWYVDNNTFTNATIKVQLEYGNKKNSFTPYGTTPIELCKTGDYQDYFGKSDGRNLFDKETITNGYYYDTSGNYVAVNETYVSDFIEVNANDSYTLQTSQSSSTKRVNYFDSNKTWLSQVNTNNTDYTFTTPNNTKYIRVSFNQLVNKDNIQIEEGTTATTYEPYGVGKWYLHKEIGKVVLDSTLSGIGATNFSNLYQIYTNILNIGYLAGGYCDNFKFNDDSRITDNNSANSWLSDNQCAFRLGNESARDRFYIKSSNFATANELKEYFNSNATIVYYALATPTNTEITYQPLIDQLNLLEKAISKDGQTNISQVNNDLGFVIYAEAIKSLENVLDRIELLES